MSRTSTHGDTSKSSCRFNKLGCWSDLSISTSLRNSLWLIFCQASFWTQVHRQWCCYYTVRLTETFRGVGGRGGWIQSIFLTVPQYAWNVNLCIIILTFSHFFYISLLPNTGMFHELCGLFCTYPFSHYTNTAILEASSIQDRCLLARFSKNIYHILFQDCLINGISDWNNTHFAHPPPPYIIHPFSQREQVYMRMSGV